MKKIIIISVVIIIFLLISFVAFVGIPFNSNNNVDVNNDVLDDSNNNGNLDSSGLNNPNNDLDNAGENDTNNVVDNEDSNDISLELNLLKMENTQENKVYSPLSVEYALKMLEEATSGDAKKQISNVIKDKVLTKYSNSNNISLANALFVRENFKNNIKQEYINQLKDKYNAEIKMDSFNPEAINTWVSEKTLNLIPNLISKIDDSDNFILVNALGIDMEWKNKFLRNEADYFQYSHENLRMSYVSNLTYKSFNQSEELYSGMQIDAIINNYDIVQELGEDYIRNLVGNEYRKWLNSDEYFIFNDKFLSGDEIEESVDIFLNGTRGSNKVGFTSKGYMAELDSNYKNNVQTTDFELYVDDNVKAFSKDLKEYDGRTLQYIGIMPINDNLDKYIETLDDEKLNYIIDNLKELKSENFKEGVVTVIDGYIPKFDFEYELNLKDDLEKLGIIDVFEMGKANLTSLTDDKDIYINDAIHKANIEFTQIGIKAAASTSLGGSGAGDGFEYNFDVPVEKIDLTFDKPYLFLIKDKKNEDIWFMGTVYEPLLWENDTTINVGP